MTAKQEVAPKQIEAKLVEIWDELQGTNKMRACLFNLIVYTSSKGRVDYLHEITQKLIERYPTRIIFITVDNDGPVDLLKTTVSVVSATKGENEIVCDLITIDVGKEKKKITPFIALPHLLPDLPVYLLWADNPCADDALASALGKYATRIIYDSDCADNLGRFAKAALARRKELGVNIADLNWRRIEGWRHMLTEAFAEHLDYLHEIKEVHITYNGGGSRVQAFYLQGWLASRLDWTLGAMEHDGDATHIGYDKEGHHTSVFLHPGAREKAGPGRILAITLVTDKEEKFVFERTQEHCHIVRFELSTPDHCEVPTDFLLERYTSGLSLARELSHKGTSPHLEKMLTLLAPHDDKTLNR